MSSDGSRLIAGVSDARLYISANSGGSWTETRPAGDANKNWITTSMNSDGSKLIAGATSGRLYLNNEPLPVELTSFTATANCSNVTLNWQTATEVNNYGFEVERTSHNPPFDKGGTQGGWETIGFVPGSGNSNSVKHYSFTDNLNLNLNLYYRLKQIDNDGTVNYSDIVEVEVNSLPTEFALSQNYPNPFNPSTVISYQLPLNSFVTLELFAVTGEKVGTLVNGEQEAGYYNFELNSAKFNLTSGIYFFRLIAGNYSNTRKLILVK